MLPNHGEVSLPVEVMREAINALKCAADISRRVQGAEGIYGKALSRLCDAPREVYPFGMSLENLRHVGDLRIKVKFEDVAEFADYIEQRRKGPESVVIGGREYRLVPMGGTCP